jgi:hypothetical protein
MGKLKHWKRKYAIACDLVFLKKRVVKCYLISNFLYTCIALCTVFTKGTAFGKGSFSLTV